MSRVIWVEETSGKAYFIIKKYLDDFRRQIFIGKKIKNPEGVKLLFNNNEKIKNYFKVRKSNRNY